MTSELVSTIRIKLSDKNGKKVEAQTDFQNASFSLTDALISEIMKKSQMDDLTSCSLIVGANNIAIEINEYTLTPNVYIENFYNIPSDISILQVKNVGVHIVKQKIDLLQVDCSSVLLADCHVNHFDAGLITHSEILAGKSRSDTAFSNIDIRNSSIHMMQIFLDCKHLNFQGSNIDVLNMHGSMKAEEAAHIHSMHIWQSSSISDMTLQYHVEKFNLEESTVVKLLAKSGCFIEQFENKNGSILNAYNFSKEHFGSISSDGWGLVAKSATNQGLLDKRAEAQYHVVKTAYQKEKGIRRFFVDLIDFCTGFGYKPIRAIRACVVMILVSWMLIVAIDIALFQISNITTHRTIVDSLLISVTAIAGQSNLLYSDGFIYWIALGEYIGAVILFAMFVNALYVRYKD